MLQLLCSKFKSSGAINYAYHYAKRALADANKVIDININPTLWSLPDLHLVHTIFSVILLWKCQPNFAGQAGKTTHTSGVGLTDIETTARDVLSLSR